jgi:hypothetical protein
MRSNRVKTARWAGVRRCCQARESRSGAQSAQATEARTVSRGPLPPWPKSMDESQ